MVKTDRFGVTKHKRYQLQDVSVVKYAHGGVTLEGSSVSLELFHTRRSYQERAWAHGRELAAFLNLEFVEETALQPEYTKFAAMIQRLPVAQALQTILLRHLRELAQPDIYVGSNIPAGSLRTAIQHYAPGCATTETPLLFLDASSWSTANGVLLTDTRLYTRDPATKMPLQTEITQLTELQVYHTHCLYRDGKKMLHLRLPEETIRLIATIVSEMAASYRRVPLAVRMIDCFVLTFGAVNITLPDSTYIFANPDFEHKETPIEISAVYIDTTTCDRLLLERFLTYIVNYPPKKGVKSVQIFYQGNLNDLGDNLKNALQNNFIRIEEIP